MIALAVCTYRRPDYLERLLRAFAQLRLPLRDAVPEAAVFIIVDNDGNDPAVPDLVASYAAHLAGPVEYIIEREPGISAARNAAFGAARRLGADWLAMLDDDEWPPEHWLEALLAERDRSGASVVGGPVRPVFPEDRPKLSRLARFWSVEREYIYGKPFVFCTCNFLIGMAAVAFLGDQPFNPAFGITGGGDTVFFRQLFDAGVAMSWSEDAWISEEIPASRASVDWLRKRRYRMGNAAVRWERDAPVAGDIGSVLRTAAIILRLPVYPLFSREKSDLMLAWLLEFDKLRGRLAAQFGSVYSEYARGDAGAGMGVGIGAGKPCR